MKKKMLSLLLAVCLLVGALPMMASAEDVVEYPLNKVILSFDKDTGTITDIGYSEDVIAGRPGEDYPFDTPLLLNVTLDIPAEIDGVAVREIGEWVFSGWYALSYVTIPSSVTKIGAGAFDFCRFITFVSIPDSVTEIGEGAFRQCWSLQSALIPGSVKKISELAFGDCDQLASVTLQDGVTEICDQAFSWCYGLDAITIPASVTSIGENVFEGTKNVTIYGSTGSYAETYAKEHGIPFAVESTSGSWGENAAWSFDRSTGTLTVSGTGEIKNEDSDGSLSKAPWRALCGEIRNVVIEDGITRIGNRAFSDCAGLVSVTIPDSVTSIGRNAFSLCYGLTAVTIPDSVTEMEQFAFWKCYNLTICGKTDSCAETYAKENNIPFTAVTTPPPTPPAPGPVNPTPAPTVTTNPDGSQTETQTAEDGTVTAITIWEDGKQAVSVKTPEGETTVSVTAANGEKMAEMKLPAQPAEGKDFEDVKSGAWYETAVENATGYGLFNGTGETTFSPNDPMTRGMLATVLHNLSGKPAYGTDESVFADVTSGRWYENPAEWAYKAGVTSGTGKTEFSPNRDITREQLVTMLYNYAKLIGAGSKNRVQLTGFPDGGKVADYAKEAMQWAVAEGFISGRAHGGKNYAAPKDTATRAEVASVLTRFVEYLKK